MTTTTQPADQRQQPVERSNEAQDYQPRRSPRVTTRFASAAAPLFHAWRP